MTVKRSILILILCLVIAALGVLWGLLDPPWRANPADPDSSRTSVHGDASERTAGRRNDGEPTPGDADAERVRLSRPVDKDELVVLSGRCVHHVDKTPIAGARISLVIDLLYLDVLDRRLAQSWRSPPPTVSAAVQK